MSKNYVRILNSSKNGYGFIEYEGLVDEDIHRVSTDQDNQDLPIQEIVNMNY